MENLVIAVDFDGTIVEHKYPEIGKEIPFAFDTLKMLQKKGFRLILWTVRYGSELDSALEFCSKRGLDFYAVNKNYPEEEDQNSISRKILADIYIDDRNFGGLPDWGEIYNQLTGSELPSRKVKRQKGFLGILNRS